MESRLERLRRRLSSYWKLEVANAALIPATILFVLYQTDEAVGLGLAIACVPMCGLLLVGGLYWRGKLQQLEGQGQALEQALRLAAGARLPLLATTFLALVLAVGVWFAPGLAASAGERWAITGAAVLAALEYVNYYHRQLQHFDNAPDFRRLVTGRGFQRAWMARDLDRMERNQPARDPFKHETR
jgi:hypothetical protein